MSNYILTVGTKEYDVYPDIFHAAMHDDVEELRLALNRGQSLSARMGNLLNMTPIHIACLKHSNRFIDEAQHHRTFNPFIRDDNLRVAFDHASAYRNMDAMRILYKAMYPPMPGQNLESPIP